MELEDPLEEQGEPLSLNLLVESDSHVRYRYETGSIILNDLSFDFYPGSCTAILSETG